MSIHWTEYPERVETLGALSSILVTLDTHEMETGFTADSFRKERGRTTAYTVDFHNEQYRFHPRLDQMPGLERLLDRFGINGHDSLTLGQFRELRNRVVSTLKSTRTEVDAMTFIAIADALDAAECRAIQARVSADAGANGPSPSHPAAPECSPGALVVCSNGDEPLAPVHPQLEPIVYQLPGLDAESIPTDLRESLEAAWWLATHANLLAFWARAAIDPILRPTRIVHNQGTPEERVVDTPPLEMTADTVVEVIEEVDRHHRLCVERLHATRNALIASGDVYSDGELHAPCAHDAALKFANDIRRNVDLFIRITSRKPGAMTSGFLPAIELRPVWDNFVRVLRSAPGTFDGLPSVHKLHAALLRETVKAAREREQSAPSAPALDARETGPHESPGPPERPERPHIVINDDGSDEAAAPLEPRLPPAIAGYRKLFESDRLERFLNRVPESTRPAPPEPPPEEIEAAALRLCDALAGDAYGWSGEDGARFIALDVAQRGPGLEPSPFNRPLSAAFHHAVCWLVRADLVTVEILGSSARGGGDTAESLRECLVATPELWKRRDSGRIFGVPNPGAPTGTSPELQQEGVTGTNFTMGDIRDLLRYQRDLVRYEEWLRRTHNPGASVTEAINRVYSSALSYPQMARLTPDRAAGLAVYRRLVRSAHETFHKELDEQALLYFVGEVADQHGRAVEEMWALSTDEFGPLMGGPVDTSGSSGTGRKELNTPEGSLSPPVLPTTITANRVATAHRSDTGVPKLEVSGGGRPKLGDGPNATPQDKARRNVYELVRVVRKPGLGPKQLWRHFRHDKDFKERVREAGEELGEPLFRKAIAWIEENPDQETQSGNVS